MPSGPLPATAASRAIGSSQKAANTVAAGAISRSSSRFSWRRTGMLLALARPPAPACRGVRADHRTVASTHLGQVAVDEGFLRRSHLGEIDRLGARIVAVRQELRLGLGCERHGTYRAQEGVGPDRLAFVRQPEI